METKQEEEEEEKESLAVGKKKKNPGIATNCKQMKFPEIALDIFHYMACLFKEQ